MTKEKFIEILYNHAKLAGLFGNRFVCVSSDNSRWVYHRPAIDCLEPSIDIKNDNGIVLYYPNNSFGDKIEEKITYEDFVKKFNLIKE